MNASHDFDFLFGTWNIRHRRLRERLSGSDAWDLFDGTSQARPILGGNGNIDEHEINLPGGAYRAVTLRSFDPGAGTWAIWWLDARAPHVLDVPVIGGFEGDYGSFFARDTLQGRPIVVRFQWIKQDATSCQWQQAFSDDDGANWETNWIMDLTRRL